MSRLGMGTMIVALLAALLACGGGGSDKCSASINYEGKAASGKGEDRLAARHTACRSWCKANDPASSDRDMHNACASRCGGDLMFGKGTAQVDCK